MFILRGKKQNIIMKGEKMKKVLMAMIFSAIILALSVPGQAQIVNGDFEAGVIAPATTNYTYVDPVTLGAPPNLDLAQYTVDTSPSNVHEAWVSYGDKTSGFGKMLIVNGANVPGITVWEQTVTVIAGAEYTFSYWLRGAYDTDPSLAKIQTSINSFIIDDANAQQSSAGWVEVSYTWNSGINESATITLEDMTLAYDGDDFAIDDISIELVPATITKTVDPVGTVELGDHLDVELDVNNPYDNPVTVVDEIPDGLAYIPGTFYIDSVLQIVDPTVVNNVLTTTVGTGSHTIEFELQVVGVGYEDVDVTNTAKVYAPGAIPGVDAPDDSADSDLIILSPYDAFSKTPVGCNIPDGTGGWEACQWDDVPWHTDVHWWIEITVEDVADEVTTMENVVVTDNLGGDLELDAVDDAPVPASPSKKKKDSAVSVGPVTIERSGDTEKVHLSWAVGGLPDTLTLEISTDWNPGHGKKDPGVQEYTSLGSHDLNSGATLKFTDPSTGLQLSAHTAPLTVTAHD
jgi:hypothetical protein